MKFENTFVVQAPIGAVWDTLMDVERVAPCMPGAEVLERVGDDAYKVAVKVKLGPMTMQYRGQVEIVERDADARRATMRAKAKEARGQGTADAHVYMSLAEEPGGTRARIETELQMSGKAVAMGQGVIVDVAQKLTELFAANLAEMLVAPASAATSPSPGPATGLAAATATTATTAATAAQSSLPVGQVVASVIAGRLSHPRTLALVVASLAALFGAIGYAIGKAS
jgi:uncharacterized protein